MITYNNHNELKGKGVGVGYKNSSASSYTNKTANTKGKPTYKAGANASTNASTQK